MGALTTHILDTANGCPAAGVKVNLFAVGGERALLSSTETNDDGRTDAPMLSGDDFEPGHYELEFHMGAYFDRTGADLPDPKFVDVVVLRFGIADRDSHYHVPLLASPFSYTTYRGS